MFSLFIQKKKLVFESSNQCKFSFNNHIINKSNHNRLNDITRNVDSADNNDIHFLSELWSIVSLFLFLCNTKSGLLSCTVLSI